MRFAGNVWRGTGRQADVWYAKVHILNVEVYGKSEMDVLCLICDAVSRIVDQPGFRVGLHLRDDEQIRDGTFYLWTTDEDALCRVADRRNPGWDDDT